MKVRLPLFDYEGRIVSLLGNVDHNNFDVLVDHVLRMSTSNRKAITCYLSCQGGNLHDALKVVDVMQTIKSPVTAIGMGFVEGAGSIILATAKNRWMLPSSILSSAGIWNLPRTQYSLSSGLGFDAVDLNSELIDLLEQRVNQLPEPVARFVKKAIKKPAIYSASQAVAAGLVQKVVRNHKQLFELKKHHHKDHEEIPHPRIGPTIHRA